MILVQDKEASELNLHTIWMVTANELSPIVTCTDSCAVHWGLWEVGHQEQVTIGHVTGHTPLTSLGNDEGDALARVRSLERVPPTKMAPWLHCHLQHADVKTSQLEESAFNGECPVRCLPGMCDLGSGVSSFSLEPQMAG